MLLSDIIIVLSLVLSKWWYSGLF